MFFIGERHTHPHTHTSFASCTRPDQTAYGRQTQNRGMYPDWELNPQHFGVQDDAPTNLSHSARAKVSVLIGSA